MERQDQQSISECSDMSLANVSIIPGTEKYSQDVMKKFHWAIKRVATEHGTDNETALTQEELIQLIRTWEPQRDIICLYVRWSRQLRRNFNLDSIATLLCLSRQCGYTPLDFLRKVKTLSVLKNEKAAYGVTFLFDIPHRKDINRERLTKEFLGLSVTLSLLQEQVTDSPSILGRTKMRHRGPRNTHPIGLHVEGKDKEPAVMMTQPNVEFHTQSSLLNRIWISINHRWLALNLIEHLFREANQPWSYHEALVYSFQMMAPCGPGRYEFLSPLVGYCLRFPTQESIESKRARLRETWADPSTFLSYGNTCLTQFSLDAQSRIIIACFRDLRSDMPSTVKQVTYHRLCSWIRRWNILRSYIFHFWLESVTNANLKSSVTNESYSKREKKKRKVDNNYSTITTPTDQGQGPVQNTDQEQVSELTAKPRPSKNGLQSITASRRLSSHTTTLKYLPLDGKIGECQNQSKLTSTNNKDYQCSIFQDTDWTRFRLISSNEFDNAVQSYLLIHRSDGVDILSELSPLEVYSANNLHDWSHCRLSGPSPFFPTGKTSPALFQIRSDADQFIDTYGKSFHIAREQAGSFLEHAHHLPTIQEIQVLCKAIARHGKVDAKRATGQSRLNIGNGGRNWVNGAPCQLHGLRFQKDLDQDVDFDSTEVLQSIGQLVTFTWKVSCSLQDDASDQPMAPDDLRKKLYADTLNKFLYIDTGVCFEDVTLVVSSLHPIIHEVLEHKDCMNDTLAGYTRTAAFNMVLIDDNDVAPSIIHFQVICNFRKVIGRYVVPFHSYLGHLAKHCRLYMEKWQRNIHSIYAGKVDKLPTAYDRSTFYLDDCLHYSRVPISEEGKHKQSIILECILMEVNLSRTLSLSMFIDPIVNMQRHLKFDQTIELALACSFLSNPFWFNWTMSTLLQRLDNPNDSFQLGVHPFYDWSHSTFEIFGGWQGGPYNRWSPCGGSKESVLETFGAHPDATIEQRKVGEGKLCQVVAILYEHLEWINSLVGCGNTPVTDMPLAKMKTKCNETIQAITSVASCQFSHFRLGILTTILSGCGLLKEGKHLRNCMYPVKGSASFKHLCYPFADCMSRDRALALGENRTNESITNDGEGCVAEEHHDLFMHYLSVELGFQVFVRDEMECILCESHPMRSLNCRDWFRKGMTLYDCNTNGEFFAREYGRETNWRKLCPPQQYEFAYLGKPSIVYIPVDCDLTYMAADFGAELRTTHSTQVKFKGRSTRTSGNQRMFKSTYDKTKGAVFHPSMQVADFYRGSSAKQNKLWSMFVLEDAEHAVPLKSCNNLECYPNGRRLHNYLLSLPLLCSSPSSTMMGAGCYHKDLETNCSEVHFFPGHLDKPFVHTAWFVPVGESPFFTILSVSSAWNCIQDANSLRHFQEWKSRLSDIDSRKVDEFLRDFDKQAQKRTRIQSHVRLIFLNIRGSVLSFPANKCYHATITSRKPPGFPRDLFVFHPLDGNG